MLGQSRGRKLKQRKARGSYSSYVSTLKDTAWPALQENGKAINALRPSSFLFDRLVLSRNCVEYNNPFDCVEYNNPFDKFEDPMFLDQKLSYLQLRTEETLARCKLCTIDSLQVHCRAILKLRQDTTGLSLHVALHLRPLAHQQLTEFPKRPLRTPPSGVISTIIV